MAATDVEVFGPNLSGAGQQKGDIHVHATGCADCKKYGPGKPMGGDDDGWPLTGMMSRLEVVCEVYPPGDFEWNPDVAEDADGYLRSVYFAPCLSSLPERYEAVTPAEDYRQMVRRLSRAVEDYLLDTAPDEVAPLSELSMPELAKIAAEFLTSPAGADALR